MAANPIVLNTKDLSIPAGSPLETRIINLFSSAVADDLTTIQTIVNDYLVPLVNGLPATVDNTVNPIENIKVDASQIYVDKDADNVLNSGLFYDATLQRPLTIKEALILIIQLIAKNAGSTTYEDTEEITVSSGDVLAGYVTLTDSNGIITGGGSNTKIKVYYASTDTDAFRLPPSQYSFDPVTKRLTPQGSFSLVAGDTIVVDYKYNQIVL